ncbi:putative serine/threonine-protein kinase WNK9 [Wolffia australiana]
MDHDYSGEGSSGSVEPPDCNAVEVDPTGRYIRYNEILGQGAFKTVYKAFDDVEGIEVAWNQIKIDDVLQSKGDVERVYSEVQLLKQLKHENIMKFCSSWIDQRGRIINIITELFSSGSLRQYRMKHKKVDMKVIKRWARRILAGLDYLHSHQPPIIHRDLKCDNIFINGNRGEIKIGDLGFATIMQRSNCRSVIGTPEFMAPELYDEEYNELVDIYSFGMCMLELVTFEYPYSECKNSAQIYKKVSSGIKPVALSKVTDPEVKAFIEKCIAPAKERFSAKALLMDPFLLADSLPQPVTDVINGNMYSTRNQFVRMHVNMCEDGRPEVITLVNNDDDGSPVRVVVQKSLDMRNFSLVGEPREDRSLSLSLQIESYGRVEREMHILFYLDNNSLATARGIVDQFRLCDQDEKVMSRLVDVLLSQLIPGWKLLSSTDEQLKNNEMQHCCSEPTSPFSSVTSFHNLFDPPEDSSCQIGDNKAVPIRVDNTIPLDIESLCISPTDDEVSIISMEGHDDKSSVMCTSSMIGEADGHGADVMAGVEKNQGMVSMFSDIPGFQRFPGNESFHHVADELDDDDVDDDVRAEINLIELQYREALNVLNQRRQKVIEMVKSRAAQRKRALT